MPQSGQSGQSRCECGIAVGLFARLSEDSCDHGRVLPCSLAGYARRRDGYRFVFALLFVRSLSPRLFMRCATPRPPRQLGKLQRPVPLLLLFRCGLSSC